MIQYSYIIGTFNFEFVFKLFTASEISSCVLPDFPPPVSRTTILLLGARAEIERVAAPPASRASAAIRVWAAAGHGHFVSCCGRVCL